MNRNKNVVTGLISLVAVTVVVTFGLTSMFYFGWTRFNKGQELVFNKGKISVAEVDKFNKVWKKLVDDYYEDFDESVLIEGAISGMADSLKDPYTVYFNKEQMQSFSEKTEGGYVGIGINVVMDNDGVLNVVEAFKDTPAQKAGIRQGDKIIKVNDTDVTSIKDEEMIIKMIKGKEDTNVKITVYRLSEGKSVDFNMKRKKIKISNINYEMLPGNIGYIKLVMFDNTIADDFESCLKELVSKGMQGLVIDVRDNPGGSYEEVVDIADRLLPKGVIVYTEDKHKEKDIKMSNDEELKMPIVLLVNGNSASASEVLAGALKDHKKGVLIGTKTFGKGVVQQIIGISDGSGLKVTVARYFTPSGVCIQGVGISPDFEVQVSDKYKDRAVSQIPREDDIQFKKAVEYLKGVIK